MSKSLFKNIKRISSIKHIPTCLETFHIQFMSAFFLLSVATITFAITIPKQQLFRFNKRTRRRSTLLVLFMCYRSSRKMPRQILNNNSFFSGFRFRFTTALLKESLRRTKSSLYRFQ